MLRSGRSVEKPQEGEQEGEQKEEARGAGEPEGAGEDLDPPLPARDEADAPPRFRFRHFPQRTLADVPRELLEGPAFHTGGAPWDPPEEPVEADEGQDVDDVVPSDVGGESPDEAEVRPRFRMSPQGRVPDRWAMYGRS